MKKRIFALALAVCMLLSVMPTSFAAGLSLGGSTPAVEPVEQPVVESSGGLSLGGSVQEEVEPQTPSTGVLTSGGLAAEEEEPEEEETEKPQAPTGVLYTQCAFCGYLDNTHADDCPTLQPEEEQSVEEPASQPTQVTQEEITTKTVTNYTAETVSTQSTSGSERLNIQRNAVAYAALSASLMTLSDEGEDVAAQAEERVDNANIVTNKTVSGPYDDGAYTITLETFVTGQTTTTETQKATDMDIILILDTSREMVTEKYVAYPASTFGALYNAYDDGKELYYKDANGEYYKISVTQERQGRNWYYVVRKNDNDIVIEQAQNGNTAITNTYYEKVTTTTTTGGDGDDRLAELKTAASNFIDAIAPEGTTENNRRVALISYNSSSTVLTGEPSSGAYAAANNAIDAALRPVATEKALLKAEINALTVDTSAAAYCETALYDAKQIFQNGNDTVPTTRPRIVILLSAGVFGPSGTLESDTTAEPDGRTAMDMIWLSVILKTARGTTAAPDFTSNFYGFADRDEDSFSNAYGSYAGCGATVYCVGLGMPTTELSGEYYTTTTGTIASRINEVMYRVSSHRPDGTHVNKDRYNPWESLIQDPDNNRNDDWEGTYPDALTRNVNKLNASYTSYFLTADDATELTGIFKTISDSITTGGASIELDEKTTVVDVVSDYFVLPEGADAKDIEVYMADCTGVDTSGAEPEYSWGARSQLWPNDADTNDSITVQVTLENDNTVSVTGFDYSENWVGKDSQTNAAHGKKLIIVFKVYVSDDFLGGKDVPTNASGSHVVNGDTVFEEFVPPTVDIPVDTSKVNMEQDIETNNFNAYLTQNVDLNVSGKEIIEIPANSMFDGVNNAYVDVVFTIADAKGDEIGFYTIYAPALLDADDDETEWKWEEGYNNGVVSHLLDDQTYTITCTVGGKPISVKPTAHIYVYKPEVTFRDSTIYLSQTPDYELVDAETGTQIGNYQSVVWKHGEDNADTDKMGNAPVLAYTYVSADATFTSCTKVDVTAVAINGKETVDGEEDNYLNYVAFVNGTNRHIGSNGAKEFTVHVLKPSFTVACTDLYADFGANVTMDEWMKVGAATWSHECEEATYSTPSGWAISCNYEYTPGNMIGDGKYIMGDEDQAFSVAVTGFTIKDENNNTATYPKAETVLSDFAAITYKNGETETNAFTIHINKFDLTITKEWGDAQSDYQHDVIVALMCGQTKVCDVVVPKSGSITITGLICGKDYTLDECENWAWRFTNSVEYSSGTKATHTHTPKVSDSAPTDDCAVTAKITNTLNNPYWFDAIAETVKNIFNKGGSNE